MIFGKKAMLHRQAMKHVLVFVSLTLTRLLLFPAKLPSVIAVPQSLETHVDIEMFVLNSDGSRTDDYCSSGNTNYGCTAFEDDPTHAYPYSTSKPNVSIETDYLLDVVAQEMVVFKPNK